MAKRKAAALYQNKTETLWFPSDVAPDGDGCGFVLDAPSRFCGAPTLPRSAYCADHHRRCRVSPDSADGRQALRALDTAAQGATPLPPELAALIAIEPPELDSADEPRDLAGCIDLAPRQEDSDGDAA